MKTAALYLLLTLGIAGALSFVGKFWTYVKLADAGVQTSAVVKQQACSQHLLLRYQFSANGRPFEGAASSEECQKLAPGTAVTVFYLPADPAVSTIGDPAPQLRSEGLAIGLAALVLPAFMLWAYAKRRRTHDA